MAPSLPIPIELCLEEIDEAIVEPYLRCVAVAGGHLGLCFSSQGEVVWQLNDQALAELWVSLDNQLIFYRKQPGGTVSLTRIERHLELPLGKPVLVLDGDEVCVEGKRYRVHVHGTTNLIAAPKRLKLRRVRQAVVGAAMTAGVFAVGCRANPSADPAVATASVASVATRVSVDAGVERPADAGVERDLDAATGGSSSDAPTEVGPVPRLKRTPPIQVRPKPPAPMPGPRERGD